MSQCMVRTDGSVPMSMCHVYLLYNFFLGQPFVLCECRYVLCFSFTLQNIFSYFFTL